ncbi:hypothetical protein MHYP_G00250140 [Metynnis hypsauchen]
MWLRLRPGYTGNADRNVPLTWTNQISTQTSASKTLTIIRPPAPVSEMDRSRAILIALIYVWFSRISGAEVEMRVRPGDDVTLYSDCVWEKIGFNTVWFRNSSCQHEPPLMIYFEFKTDDPQHYTIVWNPSNKTHDLLVKNITESDVGLYYCALQERKIGYDDHVIHYTDVYHYGNRTTRISVLGSKERREALTGNVYQVGCVEEHHCERSMNGESCLHTEVCYTSLKSGLKSD